MARTSTIELPRVIALAARRLLARDGPAGMTYRALAAEAGVTVRSIQNRFGTTAGVLDYVALRGFGELRDHLLGAEGWELHTIGGPAHGVTPSPFTRRAADECLIIFDAAARSPVEGRRRFAEELGRVQLAMSGLVVGGSAGAQDDPPVAAPAPPHGHRP